MLMIIISIGVSSSNIWGVSSFPRNELSRKKTANTPFCGMTEIWCEQMRHVAWDAEREGWVESNQCSVQHAVKSFRWLWYQMGLCSPRFKLRAWLGAPLWNKYVHELAPVCCRKVRNPAHAISFCWFTTLIILFLSLKCQINCPHFTVAHWMCVDREKILYSFWYEFTFQFPVQTSWTITFTPTLDFFLYIFFTAQTKKKNGVLRPTFSEKPSHPSPRRTKHCGVPLTSYEYVLIFSHPPPPRRSTPHKIHCLDATKTISFIKTPTIRLLYWQAWVVIFISSL